MLHSFLYLSLALASPRTAWLSPAERQYFADQLEAVVQPIEHALAAKGTACEEQNPGHGRPGPPALAAIDESASATSLGYAPSQWSLGLKCAESSGATFDLTVALHAAAEWISAGAAPPNRVGPRWQMTALAAQGPKQQGQRLVVGDISATDPLATPGPAHPPVLAKVASLQVHLRQETARPPAVDPFTVATPDLLVAALDAAAALPAPATQLTPVEQLPRSTLTPSERHYFGQQLRVWVDALIAALQSDGLVCNLGPPLRGAPDGGIDDGISERNTVSRFGYAPVGWSANLTCGSDAGPPLAVVGYLQGSPATYPPFPTQRLDDGDGWLLMEDMMRQSTTLEVGQIVRGDPDKLPARAHPAVLSPAVSGAVLIRGRAGDTSSVAILKSVPTAPLLKALKAAAAIAPPRTDLKPLADAPVLTSPPPAEAYAAPTGPAPKPAKVTFARADLQVRVGQLEMALQPEEQAYFVSMRAQAFAAAAAAMKTVRRDCDYGKPERGTPEPPETAEPTPFGAFPRDWGFKMVCYDPQTLAPLEIHARLLPEWGAEALPDATRRALAKDAALETSSFGKLHQTHLVIGHIVPLVPRPARDARAEKRAAPPETVDLAISPGLMKLGAVDLDALETESEVAEKLFARVDARALRALLKSPLRPPAGRSNVAEGKPGTASREEVEAEVYRAVLEQAVGARSKATAVVISTALGGHSFGATMPKLLSALCPDLLSSTFEDFDRVLQQHTELPDTLSWVKPIVRLKPEQEKALFTNPDGGRFDGWKHYRDIYPGAAGIFSLSPVGLSRDQTQAIVAVNQQWDGLGGSGEVWLMRRVGDTWRLVYRSRQWVS